MKRNLLIPVAFLFVLFTTNLLAQSHPDRCGTMQNLNAMIQRDPQLAVEMQNRERALQEWINNNPNYRTNSTITIPVVIHVVYRTTGQNISDAQATSQITVLNEDYNRRNPDSVNTPSVWQPIAGNLDVNFCLAQQDPDGNPTTGIVHVSTTRTGFDVNLNDVKSGTTGGDDAWDPTRYLNIWCCNITNPSGVLGYGEFPSGTLSQTYGLVLQYNIFGRGGTALYPYNQGRTGSHELGHCFNLRHIWGDDGNLDGACQSTECSGTDYVGDTPNACDANFGVPSFPHLTTCAASSPGEMFCNFMDYTDDRGSNMLTVGQVTRMRQAINAWLGPLLQSDACNAPVGVYDLNFEKHFTVFPNPVSDKINISVNLDGNSNLVFNLYNSIGALVKTIDAKNYHYGNIQIDVAGLSQGIYSLEIRGEKGVMNRKMIISK